MKDKSILIQKNERLIVRSLVFLLIASGLFLSWGFFARLDSASVASGVVMVESKRKPIQHLEGGIVAEIYVHEGQKVEVGTPLIKISDVSFNSKLKETELTLISNQLQYQRLVAERQHLSHFTPDIDSKEYPGLAFQIETLIANQQALFTSRVDMRAKELAILESRVLQNKNQEASSRQMLSQKRRALKLLDDEIAMHTKLLKDGYTSRLKVIELNRSRVLMESDVTSVKSELSSLASSLEELEHQKQAISRRNRTDIENQISEVRGRLVSLESELETARDVQSRTIVKSPSSGVVLGMNVNSIGEVVGPGQPIMEIVPNDEALIIEAMLKPTDIDSVKKGQKAMVRLSAYNSRTTPVIDGEIIYVGADRSRDDQSDKTSATGYKIKVKLRADELADNPNISLYPGMPAEVYVLLKEKRPLDYLLEPLEQSLFRAFRES